MIHRKDAKDAEVKFLLLSEQKEKSIFPLLTLRLCGEKLYLMR
jgi:hypothetical protein